MKFVFFAQILKNTLDENYAHNTTIVWNFFLLFHSFIAWLSTIQSPISHQNLNRHSFKTFIALGSEGIIIALVTYS